MEQRDLRCLVLTPRVRRIMVIDITTVFVIIFAIFERRFIIIIIIIAYHVCVVCPWIQEQEMEQRDLRCLVLTPAVPALHTLVRRIMFIVITAIIMAVFVIIVVIVDRKFIIIIVIIDIVTINDNFVIIITISLS